MFKKYFCFLLISFAAITAIIGCHTGGHAPFINRYTDPQITSEERIVNNGIFDDIQFPFGSAVRCSANKTFQDGVKVRVIEEKTAAELNYTLKPPYNYIYTYKISAVLPSTNPLTEDIPVSTLENPLTISIPNNSTDGTCYIGLRTSDNEPWRYCLANDGNNANIASSRLARTTSKEYTLELYRLGQEFRLFSFDNLDENKALVDSLSFPTDTKIGTKDNKYIGNLSVKVILNGLNLDNIDYSNLVARVTYRSQNEKAAEIKGLKQTDLSDKAVSGKFAHFFEIENLNVESQMSGEAVFSFVLNLNGIKTEDFPTSFLVEFFNKNESDKVLPFIYTKVFSFVTEENQDTPEPLITYEISYNLDGGNPTGDNPTSYDENTETFTLSNPTKEGYSFTGWTGSNGNTPETTVIVTKGTTGDLSYTANWKQNAPDEYNLNLVKGEGIASVSGDGTYIAGDSITASCTLLDGYVFDSWTGDFTTESFTMPANNVTMTANAKPILYNITFELDRGQITADNPLNYTVETETFNLPIPTRDGYEFTGWTGSNGDTPQRVVKIEKGTTGNKTYTAKYSSIAYTITYTLGSDDVANDNPRGYNNDTETFTLNEPTRKGYTFAGWTGSNGDTPQTSVTIAKGSTGNKAYTANWSINSYNLTLNKSTGINTVTGSGSHEYNSKVTASCTMLDGYEFDSWTGDFTTDTFTMPAQNATMTANAKPINYNITYVLADGKLAEGITNPTTYNVDSDEITLNNPTKTGFTFLGWTYEGQTTPKQTMKIEKGSTTGDKTFTANYNLELTLSIDKDVDSIIEEAKSLFYTKATFTITPTLAKGISLTSSDKSNLISALKVKDSQNNSVTFVSAEWNDESKIALKFTKDLEASTTYTISFDDNIEGISPTCIPYEFKTFYFKGRGINGNPYLVETAQQLNFVRNYPDKHFKQTENINLKEFGNWSPIDEFKGNYNGNHKSISNLSISTDSDNIGLFRNNKGNISNITIINASIQGYDHVGTISGMNYGPISSCHIYNSTISGKRFVGGIVSDNNSPINFCYVASSTIQSSDSDCYIGGIVGDNWEPIKACYITNSVVKTTSDYCYVGGIVGHNWNAISSCYIASSTIKAGSNSAIGGIAGKSSYTINNGKDYYGNISSCYVYDANVSCDGATDYLGILVGNSSYSTVKDCFYNKITDLYYLIGGFNKDCSNCYTGIDSYNKFSTDNDNPRNWSDGLTYDNVNSVWKDYTIDSSSNWPPQLKENQ